MKNRLFFFLMAIVITAAGCNDTRVFIREGQTSDLQRKHHLVTDDDHLEYRGTGSKIPLYAGKMISSDSWQIYAELNFVPAREDVQRPTLASFVLNQNSIILDGEGHRILTSGKDIGENEIGAMSDFIEYGLDFILEVKLIDQKLGIYINQNMIAELDYKPDENALPMKIGFNPNGAVLNLKEFSASAGDFTDMELLTFTIPQIDLNDRTDLQVVIDKDTVEYLGHPSSVLLDDGKTITMMYLNGHAYGKPRWKRSFDGGLTWTDPLQVSDQWNKIPAHADPGTRQNNPLWEVTTLYRFPTVPDVDRICMYTGRLPSRYAVSEDGGASWSELQPLLFDGEQVENAIVLFSDIIRLNNDSYMATFHKWVEEGVTVFKAITTDGLSFGKPEPIARHEDAILCEAEFIRSPDGKRIVLLMRENSRQHQSFISFSDDEGMSWTTPREVPPSLTGDRHKALYAPDGRLIISFRDRGHDSPTWGSWVAWVGTFEDLESGNEGQYRIFLKKNYKRTDCAYPTLHLLPDGTIFLATYGQWDPSEPNYILSLRLKMEELDKLYKETEK
ncbi:MAG: exo-alpha-sialidase [Bacteroidales bacterium]|nr:exo-alpha-sialidase [Bacteroidales bacterium]